MRFEGEAAIGKNGRLRMSKLTVGLHRIPNTIRITQPIPKQMNDFEQTARPVMFEHPDDAFPYWGKGSSMLLANSKHFFWITATHVLKNMGGTIQALRIFPSDNSRISLPFNEQYTIKSELPEDEDYRDVFALRIDIKSFTDSGDAPLFAQDTEQGLFYAENLPSGAILWIIGYPAERNEIDYDQGRIRNSREVIRAEYIGPSSSEHCHIARVNSSISLQSFDGLSGSPVFYLQSAVLAGQEVLLPKLVGMLIRGTASSQLVHFVSSKVIDRLVQLASDGEPNQIEPT